MGKLETETDSTDFRDEQIGLGPLRGSAGSVEGNGARNITVVVEDDNKSKSSNSPASSGSSSSLGRKKWSVHKANGRVGDLDTYNGVYRAKEFDTAPPSPSPEIRWAGGPGDGGGEDEGGEVGNEESSLDEAILPEAKPVPFYQLVSPLTLI